jgi:hypothetical protein
MAPGPRAGRIDAATAGGLVADVGPFGDRRRAGGGAFDAVRPSGRRRVGNGAGLGQVTALEGAAS